MWNWLGEHSAELGVLLNLAMLVVWISYLQLFFGSLRRANRAVIHIGGAIEQRDDARCLVTNMGSDTVYILAIKVELECGGRSHASLVTDRLESDDPLGGDFRDKTNQGPLAGGQALDIGSFQNISWRAARNIGKDIDLADCGWIEVTVVVAAQQAHKLEGGYKRFGIERGPDGKLCFRSGDVLTRQISGMRRRRDLTRMITE